MAEKRFNKKRIVSLVLTVICSAFLFASCTFFDDFTRQVKLETPFIGIDLSEEKLSWSSIENATKYNIYLNSVAVAEVASDEGVISYDYSDLTKDAGEYAFFVEAASSSSKFSTSQKSNLLKVSNNGTVSFVNDNYFSKTVQNDTLAPTFSVSDGTLNITGSADLFVIEIFCNSKKLTVIETTNNSVDISDFLGGEILVIRVGSFVESDDELYVSNNYYYHNPNNFAGYTDKMYFFDGEVHDHFIDSQHELNNVLYYNFIKRNEVFEIMLSSNMASYIQSLLVYEKNVFNKDVLKTFGSQTEKQIYVIDKSYDNFVETSYYGKYATKKMGDEIAYQLKFDFYDVVESVEDLDLDYARSRDVLQNIGSDTSYTRYDYENVRDENYDDFVSDKYFLKQAVKTSEELYWAVENKITPIPLTGSRAERIYNDAKRLLINHIEDDMSDYEKALAIFDLIAMNTVYDYLDDNLLTGLDKMPTRNSSYYLEGVFYTGYAVCDGYSKTFSLLCNMEGIETIRIVGTAQLPTGSGLHAWNKVKIENNWYAVDLTWTELMNMRLYSTGEVFVENLAHKYFLVTDKFIADTHFPLEEREKFSKYPTVLHNYNFYEKTKLVYKNADLGIDIEEDLVINSDAELENFLYYYMYTNMYSNEIILTYEYAATLTQDTALSDVEAFFLKLKSLKFPTQYLHIVRDTSYFLYDGVSLGKIFLIEFSMLLDEDGELEQIYEFYSELQEHDTNAADFQFVLWISKEYFESKVTPVADRKTMLQNYLSDIDMLDLFDIAFLDEGYATDGSGDYFYLFVFALTNE